MIQQPISSKQKLFNVHNLSSEKIDVESRSLNVEPINFQDRWRDVSFESNKVETEIECTCLLSLISEIR